MWKKCFFCKKLVRTIGSISQSPSVSSRKKKVPKIKFKRSSMTTNQRRFSNDRIPTRIFCKKCKTKDKTLKPLQYLMKALSNTICEGYDIEHDTKFCPDDAFNIDSKVDDSQCLTEIEEAVLCEDENVYALMTDKETVFWGGAVHTLDNVAVQQGILKEFFDTAPENILRQPELLRDIFEHGPEQLAERQRLMRVPDENILQLHADQQRLLQEANRYGQERIADQHIHLQEVNVLHNRAVQQELDEDNYLHREQNVELQRLLPERNKNDEHLEIQQRLRDSNDNEPELNAFLQRPDDDDVNHKIIFHENADIVSKHVAIEMGLRVGNGKSSDSFSVRQKFIQHDENSMHDMLIVNRTLLQESEDHIQENEHTQKPLTDQISHFQEDDSDMLDLLNAWKGFSLNEVNMPTQILNKQEILSEKIKNAIQPNLPQENNVPQQYGTSKKIDAVTSDQQIKYALNEKLQSNHDWSKHIFINSQLTLHQELRIKKGSKKAKKMHQRSSQQNNKKPTILTKGRKQKGKSLLGKQKFCQMPGQKGVHEMTIEDQQNSAMPKKLLSNNDIKVKNQLALHHEPTQEGYDKVGGPISEQQGKEICNKNNCIAKPKKNELYQNIQHDETIQYQNNTVINGKKECHNKLLSSNENMVTESTADKKEFVCKNVNNKPNISISHEQKRVINDNLPDSKAICQKLRLPEGKNDLPYHLFDESVNELTKNNEKSLCDHHHNAQKLTGQIRLSVNTPIAHNEYYDQMFDPLFGQTSFSRKRVNEIDGESAKVVKKTIKDTIAERRIEELLQ